jgi:hypothetical protein
MRYWPHSNDILVTPDQLWLFAWSAPMRDLAKSTEMSDVGLKKLLCSHGIATPPQGYWNKVHAGRRVPERPKTPPRGPGQADRIRLDSRFAKVLTTAASMPPEGPFASELVPENLEDLREKELRALGRVGTSRDLSSPHPGLVQLLKREEIQRSKFRASGYSWHEPVFDTPIGQRKLRLLNAIFRALAKRGHSGDAYERDGEVHARAIVGSTYMAISIDIVGKQRTAQFRGYDRPARELPASTPLMLSIDPRFRGQPAETWRDDEKGKLESKIAPIAAGIIVAGEGAFRRGLREEVERLEEARKLEEKMRLVD